ncbi:hypothetical protein CEUSTIGMA_g12691.t1 [Chlamydomonas eustigma]|uniref:Uncharacterized protein n=1 Tax=Chlamydomonas eustigma TaxID=1157962 RepID=A0A250XQR3_9CHLO|nr:hypothetical protein CEUSTIGMA_g12691.t1 [Chlamydomonas eustigma]|eukprot:GAX85272.1 hypothetical protein CEUSTIGMA_g12691.t1 [Chlamydomonas eustigma]
MASRVHGSIGCSAGEHGYEDMQKLGSTSNHVKTRPEITLSLTNKGDFGEYPKLYKLASDFTCTGSPHRDLPGQWLFEGFVTAEEEGQLLKILDTHPPDWREKSVNGRQR